MDYIHYNPTSVNLPASCSTERKSSSPIDPCFLVRMGVQLTCMVDEPTRSHGLKQFQKGLYFFPLASLSRAWSTVSDEIWPDRVNIVREWGTTLDCVITLRKLYPACTPRQLHSNQSRLSQSRIVLLIFVLGTQLMLLHVNLVEFFKISSWLWTNYCSADLMALLVCYICGKNILFIALCFGNKYCSQVHDDIAEDTSVHHIRGQTTYRLFHLSSLCSV
jgi:hypothetical protein